MIKPEKIKFKNGDCLYYMEMPYSFSYEKIYPNLRQEEIDNCKNEDVKKEKYFVWKLLLFALKDEYGLKQEDILFDKNKFGKWVCNKCYFSLSHRKEYVCVAISKEEIGIDIEKIHVLIDRFEQKILTDKELEEFKKEKNKQNDLFLITKWTEKESAFKLLNDTKFNPKKIETSLYFYEKVFLKNSYVISVCKKRKK